jgi:hypothetical protein
MEKSQNLKRLILIEELECYVGESSIWQTIEKVSENTGLSIEDIKMTISNNSDFAQKPDERITTRRNWKKWTPFWKQVLAMIVNRY